MALNKIKLSLNILSFVERDSLFHTVGYKNHSVGYIFHTVKYISRSMKQRNVREISENINLTSALNKEH